MKKFRLVDSEHDDSDKDFTFKELKTYLDENSNYFDYVGSDYDVIDLQTGEQMSLTGFKSKYIWFPCSR